MPTLTDRIRPAGLVTATASPHPSRSAGSLEYHCRASGDMSRPWITLAGVPGTWSRSRGRPRSSRASMSGRRYVLVTGRLVVRCGGWQFDTPEYWPKARCQLDRRVFTAARAGTSTAVERIGAAAEASNLGHHQPRSLEGICQAVRVGLGGSSSQTCRNHANMLCGCRGRPDHTADDNRSHINHFPYALSVSIRAGLIPGQPRFCVSPARGDRGCGRRGCYAGVAYPRGHPAGLRTSTGTCSWPNVARITCPPSSSRALVRPPVMTSSPAWSSCPRAASSPASQTSPAAG